MLVFILKRLLLAVAVALTVSAVSFSLLFFAGDPAVAMAGEGASPEQIRLIAERHGFDRPLPVQYLDWLGNAVRGDLGRSWYFHLPVIDLISGRLGTTMTLGFLSIVFALVLAIPMGVAAAVWPNSPVDRLALFVSVVGQAIPSFWLGLMLIVVFSINFGLLPSSGSSTWAHFVLPTIVLGYYATPAIMRLTRAGMIDVMSADYIRTARAKGLSSARVIFKHALRNAIIPVISLAAVQLGFMLGGSIVVESIFALHGAGHLAWESIARNDLPTIQALILIFSMFYILFTLAADILNAWMDPRLRIG